jgi:hypothetical protein
MRIFIWPHMFVVNVGDANPMEAQFALEIIPLLQKYRCLDERYPK